MSHIFPDVTFVQVSPSSGRVEAEDIAMAIRPETCLVTVMMANNETGIIQVTCGGTLRHMLTVRHGSYLNTYRARLKMQFWYC